MRIMGEVIFLWRTKRLVAQLASGQVSERQKAIYLLGDIMCIFFLLYIFVPPASSQPILFAEGSLVFLISVVGFLASFRSNGAGEGKDFVDSFVCLTFPILLKVNVIIWAIYAVVFRIIGNFLHQIPEQYYAAIDLFDQLVTSGSIVAAVGVFFVLMIASIKKIQRHRGRSSEKAH